MKSFRRCLSVLLCLVLSLSVFSVNAFASTSVELKPYHVFTEVIFHNREDNPIVGTHICYPNNGTIEAELKQLANLEYFSNTRLDVRMTIANDDGTSIVKAGGQATITIEQIPFKALVANGSGASKTYYQPDEFAHALVFYADGSMEYADGEMYSATNSYFNVRIKAEAEQDILKIEFYTTTDLSDILTDGTGTIGYAIGEINNRDASFIMSVMQATENDEKLDGIIGWLTNIWNKLTSGFDGIISAIGDMFAGLSDKLTSVVESIVELPSKTWEFIENGLKSLFVPDVQYISDFKGSWDELLAQRFGALYESISILVDSWDSVMNAGEQDTISIPLVTIPLAGEEFSFGGYEVDIVPDGFEALATSVKLAVGLLGTVYFIGGARRRMEEVIYH